MQPAEDERGNHGGSLRSASSVIFTFNSPENLRRFLVSYPSVNQRNTP